MTTMVKYLILTDMPHPDITFGLAFIKGNVDTEGESLFNASVDDLCAMTEPFPRCEVHLAGETIGLVCMTGDLRPVVIFRPEYHGTDHPALALNTYIKEFSHLPKTKPYVRWSSTLLPFSQCRRIVLLPTRTVDDEVQIHRNLDLPLVQVVGNMFTPKGVITKPNELHPMQELTVMIYDPSKRTVGLQDANIPGGYMYHVPLRDDSGNPISDISIVERLEQFKPLQDKLTVTLDKSQVVILSLNGHGIQE